MYYSLLFLHSIYINKSDRGMSTLLQDAVEDTRRGNYSLKEKLKLFGNTFISCSETSAQEAVYLILGKPLSMLSRDCVFISTGHPQNRVRILKPRKLLDLLPTTSTNVFVSNNLDHYVNRPVELTKL